MTLQRVELPTATSKSLSRTHSGVQPVLFVFGTRPEAVKLCPLILTLRKADLPLNAVVCVTGQHREMLHQVLEAFHVEPDFDLDVMTKGQSLNLLSSRLLSGLEEVFDQVSPALTVVQGDTTTTLCGALASFHRRVPVAHVEAGLRTYDLRSPFPEEGNRLLTDRLTQLHFAATQGAADNLLREGFSASAITISGNTGIDAVLSISASLQEGRLQPKPFPIDSSKRLILVTAHRRESFGPAFEQICAAVAALADRDDVQIFWPVHPNPLVKATVESAMSNKANVILIEPLDYVSFVSLMCRSYFILTDSGGVQEEAPSLGKPVLVLRDKTERPEGIAGGTVRLVGTTRESILRESNRLLDDPGLYDQMAQCSNPYGDGNASARITEQIAAYLFPATDELT